MRGLLVWMALGAAAAWAAQDFANASIDKARDLARSGNLSEAERTLKTALANQDESAKLHGELGLLLYRQGRFQDAVPELGRAAQLDPDSAEYSLKLAACILGDRRYGVATEFLQAIASRFGKLAEYQYNLGLAHFGARDYRQAIAAFEEAVRIDPKMDLAYFFLANTWATSGDMEKAVATYRKALELNPTNPGYCLAIGKVLGQTGPEHDGEAIQWLRKALELRPGDPPSEFALALACERVDDLACARPLLEDVARRYPDELSPAVVLARIYGKLNEAEKAAAARATVQRLQSAAQTAPKPDRFPER